MSPGRAPRGPSKSERTLMGGFVLPIAVFAVALAVLLLVNGVWLPGLGFLIGGCVLGMAARKVLGKGSGRP
jgi:membrane protein implicated in regulation of membrane protease activity